MSETTGAEAPFLVPVSTKEVSMNAKTKMKPGAVFCSEDDIHLNQIFPTERTCQACGVICEPVEVHVLKRTNQTTTSAILHLCERCSDNHFETLKKGK